MAGYTDAITMPAVSTDRNGMPTMARKPRAYGRDPVRGAGRGVTGWTLPDFEVLPRDPQQLN